jgi:hypothetical protein
MTTAAANYRVCKREHCPASERLVNGQWVSNAQAYRRHVPVIASSTRQHVLWDTGAPVQSSSTPSTRKES